MKNELNPQFDSFFIWLVRDYHVEKHQIKASIAVVVLVLICWWRCGESDGRKSKQCGELFARPGRASADLYKVVRTSIKMCACDVRGSSIGQAGRLPPPIKTKILIDGGVRDYHAKS